MKNLIPVELSEDNIFIQLRLLHDKYTELYGDSIYTKDTVPKERVGQALVEFLDLVMFTSSVDKKNYLMKRLVTLKSTEKLLEEIENYLPIEFNRDIDVSTGLSKTYYTPRLLKVIIKSLTITNLSSNYIPIIDEAFNNLLYFLKSEISIEELIYRLEATLTKTLIKTKVINLKSTKLDFDYYL